MSSLLRLALGSFAVLEQARHISAAEPLNWLFHLPEIPHPAPPLPNPAPIATWYLPNLL